jgi:hypothetical protein
VTVFAQLAPPYALVEELRQYLSIPPEDTADDVDLQRALDAGKSWIDWFTGRSFGVSPDTTSRTYAAATLDALPVIDLQSVTPTIAADSAGDRTFATVLVPEQYSLEPLDGPPFDTVRLWPLPPVGTEPYVFAPGELVRVTGAWGYTDARGRCPANVSQANLLLGARWFKRREVPLGVLAVPELGASQTLPATDQDVYALLFPFSRPGSPGATLAGAQAGGAAGYGAAWTMV